MARLQDEIEYQHRQIPRRVVLAATFSLRGEHTFTGNPSQVEDFFSFPKDLTGRAVTSTLYPFNMHGAITSPAL